MLTQKQKNAGGGETDCNPFLQNNSLSFFKLDLGYFNIRLLLFSKQIFPEPGIYAD